MDAARTAAARARLRLRFEGLFEPGPSESLFVQPLINEAVVACRQEARQDQESLLVAIIAQANLEEFTEQLMFGGRVPKAIMDSYNLRARLLDCITPHKA